MHKIAAMGDRDSIYGFSSIGLDIFPEDAMESPSLTLHNLVESGYAVIYITENLAEKLESELEKYRDRQLPVIVPIPGITGNHGMGMKAISKSIEKAVGSDILADT
jgi:V/A-type H+-transporting ATPase subunit F